MNEHPQDCLVPGCERSISSRGLCRNHYTYANRCVLKNKTSWEKLEDLGKCLPSKGKVATTDNAGNDWIFSEEEE